VLPVQWGTLAECGTQLAASASRATVRLTACADREGDRVGTLAWNTTRHLEAWCALFLVAGLAMYRSHCRASHGRLTAPVEHVTDRCLPGAVCACKGSGGARRGRYGIMGLGAVCHTLNPRLFAADLAYIINHGAESSRWSAAACLCAARSQLVSWQCVLRQRAVVSVSQADACHAVGRRC